MPASRSRNTEWRRSLQQVMEKGGGLELAIARSAPEGGEHQADLVWRTKLTQLGDDFIEVERPQALGKGIDLQSGVAVVAAFVIGQNRFTFDTSVLGSMRSSGARPMELLRLSVPQAIERCQRRFDRFDLQGLNLPTVTLWPLLDPKSVIPAERANELAFEALQKGEQPPAPTESLMPQVGPPINATLMNIGGGGVGLRVAPAEAGALSRHRVFWMKVPLGEGDPVPLVTTAKVVHTHIDSTQNTYAGVSFDFSFNPGHQGVVTAQITRHVQRVQAKQLPHS
jgi:hypothetical protein